MIGKVSTLLLLSTALFASGAQADVSISDKATQNMNCSNGVCTPTAKKAILNVTDLANMLASGDVTVNTGGGLAKDIDISAALSWASTSRLTLDAYRSLTVKKPVSVTGTGALTATTNDGGTDGDLLFENKGNVTFWDLNSNLVINGNSYILVGDIRTLAADIAANPSGFYALANSYDAKHDRFDKVPIATTFSGTFEGLGQTISHLKIRHDLKHWEGFFAGVGSTGIIRDTRFTHADIGSSSSDNYVGIIVGSNSGTVMNVSADGQVAGVAVYMGGLVGQNNGTIINASAAVEVTGGNIAGGLVGDSQSGQLIERSYATGNVSGEVAGGLAGNGSSVILCFATGAITGHVIGGLIGVGDTVEQSFASGNVNGDESAVAGGLIGNGSKVSNSYDAYLV